MTRRSILQALMSGNYYIGYYPSLAHALGAPSAAIFLAKIAEWEPYSSDGWVFRKGEDLYQETGMTRDMQRTARRILVKKGVMAEDNKQVHGKLMYKIDWERLEEVLQEYESSQPLVENPHLHWEIPPSTIGNNPISINSVRNNDKEEVVPTPIAPTPFTLFCDLMIAEGLEVTDHDRTAVAGNLGKVAKSLKDGETIGKVIRHMIDRRVRGIELSPQRALNDVRTGIVNSAKNPPSSDEVIKAFEAEEDRLVKKKSYLGYEWDFTRPERPPWQVMKALGESDAEQEKIWKRMRKIALEAAKGE